MTIRLMTVALRHEQDVVGARQRARQIAGLLGFDAQDQARIATAVSEIARNAFRYAGGGEVEFSVEEEHAPQRLSINVRDSGPGIAQLAAILDGSYRSATGMGQGINGARRLMDQCLIRSAPGATSVLLEKALPEGAEPVTPRRAGQLASALAAQGPLTPLDELQQQNREMLRTLGELRERQDELLALNRELEDTNRGVVALYAELEERADFLRRADETKTRFLSNMSHEFRTPLNSIRALTRMLLDELDGPINEEQRKQLEFVRKAAGDLGQLVDDLLDLAKIEAGKIEVRPAEFSIEEVFGALRGMLRPLLVTDSVALRFEAEEGLPLLCTDEGMVSQILRNFISNALKFTERGEIRVTANLAEGGGALVLAVADTGIGIAPEDQAAIFEEFTQVRNPLQAKVKGTGLGLPLCRRLASLLGGRIDLSSQPGLGSTFSVTVPLQYAKQPEEAPPQAQAPAAAQSRPLDSSPCILVIDDDPAMRYAIRRFVDESPYQVIEAADAREGLEAAAAARPDFIVLDLNLPDRHGEELLGELASSEPTRGIPVVIATSEQLSAGARERLGRQAAAVLSKQELDRELFVRVLDGIRRAVA